MFTHLTDTAKAFLFFGIAFGLTLTASLLYPLLGEITAFIHTYTPTLSVLIMMLVVTRDGYSKTGWATLGLHRLGLRYWVLALVGPLVLMGALYGIAWISPVGQFVLPDGFTLAPTGVQFEHRARVSHLPLRWARKSGSVGTRCRTSCILGQPGHSS